MSIRCSGLVLHSSCLSLEWGLFSKDPVFLGKKWCWKTPVCLMELFIHSYLLVDDTISRDRTMCPYIQFVCAMHFIPHFMYFWVYANHSVEKFQLLISLKSHMLSPFLIGLACLGPEVVELDIQYYSHFITYFMYSSFRRRILILVPMWLFKSCWKFKAFKNSCFSPIPSF